ncbi:MAG: XdhC/CoxI family protein, partial [Fimbriimonadaceae bacterium]
VSGGCVEPAVMESALKTLILGEPLLLDFGSLSDENVWEIGLSCGGQIKIWVQPEPYLNQGWKDAVHKVSQDIPTVLITRLANEIGSLQEQWTVERTNDLVKDFEESRIFEYEGDLHFAQIFPNRDRLVIIGAVHIAIPLIKFAKELGFETILVDPRSVLAAPERFAVAPDETIIGWPGEALKRISLSAKTSAVVLTHDPKIDDVALEFLLRSPVGYIGALGSRVTQAKRRKDLFEKGFSDEEIARIHGPVGLNIGGRSPEEIALSIMAEIVQVRNASR